MLLSEQQEALFPSFSVLFPLSWQGGGGRSRDGWDLLSAPCQRFSYRCWLQPFSLGCHIKRGGGGFASFVLGHVAFQFSADFPAFFSGAAVCSACAIVFAAEVWGRDASFATANVARYVE